MERKTTSSSDSESMLESGSTKTEGSKTAESSNREELNRLRKAQLAALERECELKRRTLEALRREAKERVDVFHQMAQEERETRRNDTWWSELLSGTKKNQIAAQNQKEMTIRVRQACDRWSGPKKVAEIKKLCLELEGRRRLLAGARARYMQELKIEEFVENANAGYQLHLQNYGQDRSCASCGYKSADEEDNDDTEVPGQQSPNAGGGRAEEAFLGRFGLGVRRSSVPAATAAAPQRDRQTTTPRQEQLEADYILALELQRAEMRGVERADVTGGGRVGGQSRQPHLE